MPPPPTITATEMPVRSRILSAIEVAVASLTEVGAAGVVLPGERAEASVQTILATVQGGLYAVEIYAGQDEALTLDSGRKMTGVDQITLPVVLICHLPAEGLRPRLVGPGPDNLDLGELSAGQAADYLGARLYRLYAGLAEDLSASPPIPSGRWVSAGEPAGLAHETSYIGGGAVYIDERLGTVCFEHAFEVRYRVVRGQPEIAQ